MVGMVFHEALKVQTSAHVFLSYAVSAATILGLVFLFIQMSGIRSEMISNLSAVNASVTQMLSVLSAPTRLDIP
jgi:hypothetical protein